MKMFLDEENKMIKMMVDKISKDKDRYCILPEGNRRYRSSLPYKGECFSSKEGKGIRS